MIFSYGKYVASWVFYLYSAFSWCKNIYNNSTWLTHWNSSRVAVITKQVLYVDSDGQENRTSLANNQRNEQKVKPLLYLCLLKRRQSRKMLFLSASLYRPWRLSPSNSRHRSGLKTRRKPTGQVLSIHLSVHPSIYPSIQPASQPVNQNKEHPKWHSEKSLFLLLISDDYLGIHVVLMEAIKMKVEWFFFSSFFLFSHKWFSVKLCRN